MHSEHLTRVPELVSRPLGPCPISTPKPGFWKPNQNTRNRGAIDWHRSKWATNKNPLTFHGVVISAMVFAWQELLPSGAAVYDGLGRLMFTQPNPCHGQRNRSPRNWPVERSFGSACVLFAPNSNVTAPTALNQPRVGQLIVGDVPFYVYHWLQNVVFSYMFPWIVDQHQPSTILIFHQSSNDEHWLVICNRFSESMLWYALL